MPTERELIERFFLRPTRSQDIQLGVGDDAAVLQVSQPLAITCDTLVEGTHFLPDADPFFLGRKALAVNLSDLAAMGATPAFGLLALAMPEINQAWLSEFARGFWSLADEHQLELIGGDLARATATTITVNALGKLSCKPLRQNGVQCGDDIWLSGSIGAAAWELRNGSPASTNSALHNPSARVALGCQLAQYAHAAVDLSDGFCASAMLLARQSEVCLELAGADIPLASELTEGNIVNQLKAAVCGGEDYELLFTAAREQRAMISGLATAQVPLSRIGKATAGEGAIVRLGDEVIDLAELAKQTFQHFATCPDRDSIAVLVGALVTALRKTGHKMIVAESCTGGMLASYLTETSGSSDWFEGGFVTYNSDSKIRQLGVNNELISSFGVVSAEVAEAMAKGALAKSIAATVAVAVTGWAGPNAGDDQLPGTVCIGWASATQSSSQRFVFAGSRHTVRKQAVCSALQGMREFIIYNGN